MTPAFIPGLELSRLYFVEAVKPILDEAFPRLRYAAARIGTGSEVLRFDTPMSTDHSWGPRVELFLDERDLAESRDAMHNVLRDQLPHSFRGYPTSFGEPDPVEEGTQLLEPRDERPVDHKVDIDTPRGFFRSYLGYDLARELEPADWLTFPEQKLLTLASGAVFHDAIGLEGIRAQFAYYPHDVWLYLLACAWTRIGQEEHLMGRAGSVGDEIGSAIVAARLVRDLMRLCFLMEQRYAPYAKWFGSAFGRLSCSAELSPHLRAALGATTWQERERHLVPAYELVAAMHNRLRITDPLPTSVRGFFTRPFQVIALHGFDRTILARITDPSVRRIAARRPIGSIDQFSDSTDLVSNSEWRDMLRALYE